MKKIIAMLSVLIMTALFAGCSEPEIQSEPKLPGSTSKIGIWVDPDTGVNYIWFDGYRRFGITARLNADGSPIVTEVG